jgi:tetratricopeptide (TPR) repeat protein
MNSVARKQGEGTALAFCIGAAFAALALLPVTQLLDMKAIAGQVLLAVLALGLARLLVAARRGAGQPGVDAPALLIPPPLLLALLAALGAAFFASLGYSPYRDLLTGMDPATLAGVGVLLAFSVAPLGWGEILKRAWRWSALALALYAVAQRLGIDPLAAYMRAGSQARPMATFGNPDYLAAFLCLSWPLFLEWKAWERSLALVLLFTALAMTGSRAAMLAAVCQGLLALVWARSRAPQPAAAATKGAKTAGPWTPVLGIAFCLPLLLGLAIADWHRPTLRLSVWKASLDLWLQKPWLGWGPGSFVLAFQDHAAAPLAAALQSTNQYVEDPHQLFLALACGGGILALVLFAYTGLYFARRFLSSGRGDARALGLAIIGLLIQSQADRFFFQPGVFIPLCALLGLLARQPAQALARQGAAPAAGFKPTVSPQRRIAAVLMIFVGIQALLHAYASLSHFQQAVGLSLDAGLPDMGAAAAAATGPAPLSPPAPGDAAAFEQRGADLAQQRRFPEAAAAYKEALAIQPTPGRAQNLGNCLMLAGNLQGAEASFQQEVGLDPQNSDAHFSLAYALFYEKKIKASLAELDTALKLDPDNASAAELKHQIIP